VLLRLIISAVILRGGYGYFDNHDSKMKSIDVDQINEIIEYCNNLFTNNISKKNVSNMEIIGWHHFFDQSKVGATATGAGLFITKFMEKVNTIDEEAVIESIKNIQLTDSRGVLEGWKVLSSSSYSSIEGSIWPLLALLEYNKHNEEYVANAIKWIESIQNQDGGWGSNSHSDNESRVFLTCSTLRILNGFTNRNQTSYNRAIEWLLNAQNYDGSWGEEYKTKGSVFHTARAVITLLNCGVICSSIDNAYDYIDDSWNYKAESYYEELYEVYDIESRNGYYRMQLSHDVNCEVYLCLWRRRKFEDINIVSRGIDLLYTQFRSNEFVHESTSKVTIWTIIPKLLLLVEVMRDFPQNVKHTYMATDDNYLLYFDTNKKRNDHTPPEIMLIKFGLYSLLKKYSLLTYVFVILTLLISLSYFLGFITFSELILSIIFPILLTSASMAINIEKRRR